MKIEDLKYVVGEVREAQPVYMRFYGSINEENTRNFNDEFLFIQEYVKPSKITIGINSEGGSVLYGMGTFSIIQQCPIEVETVIDGLAASMGSIIWAAGSKSYMRDYSILMIHNPFYNGDDQDKDSQQIVNAFRKQIETIYHKRFGLSLDAVRKIMNGEEGCDGTYFDARAAVKAGIVPSENIIKTTKQIRDKAKNETKGVTSAADLQKIMSSISNELDSFKPQDNTIPIPNQNQIKNSNSKQTMNDEQNFAFGSVCAQLGMDKGSEISTVVTRITALIDAEKTVKEIQNSYNALKIQKEGLDAQLTNVQSELANVKSQLKVYKDAEEAERKAEIENFIENAISEGKIEESAKSKWVEMAQGNFELVKDTLNSIPKREQITKSIAEDPENVESAKSGLTQAEAELNSKIVEAVGKDFKFKTLD